MHMVAASAVPVLLLLLLPCIAGALPVSTWNNAEGDNQWTTPGNWIGGLPTSARWAVIPSGSTTVQVTGAASAGQLTVQGPLTSLSVQSTLVIGTPGGHAAGTALLNATDDADVIVTGAGVLRWDDATVTPRFNFASLNLQGTIDTGASAVTDAFWSITSLTLAATAGSATIDVSGGAVDTDFITWESGAVSGDATIRVRYHLTGAAGLGGGALFNLPIVLLDDAEIRSAAEQSSPYAPGALTAIPASVTMLGDARFTVGNGAQLTFSSGAVAAPASSLLVLSLSSLSSQVTFATGLLQVCHVSVVGEGNFAADNHVVTSSCSMQVSPFQLVGGMFDPVGRLSLDDLTVNAGGTLELVLDVADFPDRVTFLDSPNIAAAAHAYVSLQSRPGFVPAKEELITLATEPTPSGFLESLALNATTSRTPCLQFRLQFPPGEMVAQVQDVSCCAYSSCSDCNSNDACKFCNARCVGVDESFDVGACLTSACKDPLDLAVVLSVGVSAVILVTLTASVVVMRRSKRAASVAADRSARDHQEMARWRRVEPSLEIAGDDDDDDDDDDHAVKHGASKDRSGGAGVGAAATKPSSAAAEKSAAERRPSDLLGLHPADEGAHRTATGEKLPEDGFSSFPVREALTSSVILSGGVMANGQDPFFQGAGKGMSLVSSEPGAEDEARKRSGRSSRRKRDGASSRRKKDSTSSKHKSSSSSGRKKRSSGSGSDPSRTRGNSRRRVDGTNSSGSRSNIPHVPAPTPKKPAAAAASAAPASAAPAVTQPAPSSVPHVSSSLQVATRPMSLRDLPDALRGGGSRRRASGSAPLSDRDDNDPAI